MSRRTEAGVAVPRWASCWFSRIPVLAARLVNCCSCVGPFTCAIPVVAGFRAADMYPAQTGRVRVAEVGPQPPGVRLSGRSLAHGGSAASGSGSLSGWLPLEDEGVVAMLRFVWTPSGREGITGDLTMAGTVVPATVTVCSAPCGSKLLRRAPLIATAVSKVPRLSAARWRSMRLSGSAGWGLRRAESRRRTGGSAGSGRCRDRRLRPDRR